MQVIELKGKTGIYIFNTNDIIRKQVKYSTIYKGFEKGTGKQVVIKVLKSENIPDYKNYFDISLNILTMLHKLHKGIPQTHDFIEYSGNFFLIREYFSGSDLNVFSEKNKNGKDYIIRILKIALEICNILKKLHSCDIIHRDIKPSNIIIDCFKSEKVSLIDFELAQINGASIMKFSKLPRSMIFSSPEQVLRFKDLIGPHSDIYSLAVTIYDALSSSKPFFHPNPEAVLNIQINHPLLKNHKIPPQILELLNHAAYKQPFPIPPQMMKEERKKEILMKGIEKRIKSADYFADRLSELIDETEKNNIEKKSIFSLKNIFKRT